MQSLERLRLFLDCLHSCVSCVLRHKAPWSLLQPLGHCPACWWHPYWLCACGCSIMYKGAVQEKLYRRVENPHRDLWQSEALGIVASLYTVWQLASCETALLDPKALQPSRERLLEADDAHPHSATMWFRLTKQVPSSVNIFY